MRAIESDDIPLLARWKNDPEIVSYFYEYVPIPIRTQEEWFERQRLDKSELNLIAETHNGAPIGTGSLMYIDFRNRTAEMGRVLIGAKPKRNSGLGIEIAVLLCEYAFDQLNLNKVYGDTFATNTRAVRMYASLGFSKEGVLRQHIFSRGKYVDLVQLSLLRDEFQRCRNGEPTRRIYQRCLR